MDLMLAVMVDIMGCSHRDVAAMDIACAPSIRTCFLTALQQPSFIIGDAIAHRNKKHAKCYVQWLNSRKVQIRKLLLPPFAVGLIAKANACVLRSVHEINLGEGTDQFTPSDGVAYAEVFGKCCSLRSLIAGDPESAYTINEILEQLLVHPSIPLQFFSCNHYNLKPNTVDKLVAAFHGTLHTLVMSNTSYRWAQLEAMQQCKKLEKLSIEACFRSAQVIADFLHALPALQDLTLTITDYVSHEGDAYEESFRLGDDDLSVCLPELVGLRRLCLLGHDRLTDAAFTAILKGCPGLQELKVNTLHYRALKIKDFVGCSLGCSSGGELGSFTISTASTRLVAAIQTCPVPVLSLDVGKMTLTPATWRSIADLAGGTVQTIRWLHVVTNTWKDDDSTHIFSRCSSLRSLSIVDGSSYSYNENLADHHLQIIAQHCPQITALSFLQAGGITSHGLQALLRACGTKLTKLELDKCKRVNKATLFALTEHCPNLRQLAILQTSIKADDLLLMIIMPNCLKKLRKLVLGPRVVKEFQLPRTADRRWSKVICAGSVKGKDPGDRGGL